MKSLLILYAVAVSTVTAKASNDDLLNAVNDDVNIKNNLAKSRDFAYLAAQAIHARIPYVGVVVSKYRCYYSAIRDSSLEEITAAVYTYQGTGYNLYTFPERGVKIWADTDHACDETCWDDFAFWKPGGCLTGYTFVNCMPLYPPTI